MAANAGKVALVTGSARGIGAAIVERLATDGFSVVVNYAGSADVAATLAARIDAAGGKALAVQADVSDATAVARMFDAAVRRWAASTCWSTAPAS